MILLTSTSDLVTVTTGGTQTIHVHASWVGLSGTTVTPARQNTIITTATTTTVVPSPAASTQYNLKTLVIENTDAANADTITVKHTDGTNNVTLVSLSLAAGNVLMWTEDTGWSLVTAAGTLSVASSYVDTTPATQNITAQDTASTTTAVEYQNFITGTPTAGSTAVFYVAGQGSIRLQATGTWTGTLTVEKAIDGDTTWVPASIHVLGTSWQVNNFTGNFQGSANLSAITAIRVRATAAWTGTATITVTESVNLNTVYVGNAVRLTDGTSQSIIGTIKAGSTAAAAADPSLVVALSPNSPSPPVADATATGALGALNAAVQVTMAGFASVGFQLAAGTLVGTILPEVSFDGGTTWNATVFDGLMNSGNVPSITFATANGATASSIYGAGGAGLVRVRVSAYTSGTANITLRASEVIDTSVQATIKPLYGTSGQALTITLASLANVSARGCTAVSNATTLYEDVLLFFKLETGATVTASTGYINIYGYASVDGGTTYTESFAGTDGAVTLTTPPNATLIAQINANVANTIYRAGPISFCRQMGYDRLPANWGVFVLNQSGGGLNATAANQAITYQGVNGQLL
jgi:hypothetical protein